MMRNGRSFMSKRVAAFMAFCFSCGQGAMPPGARDVQLRSYRVPDGMGQQLRSLLGNVLSGVEKDNLLGRASLAPNGELVVVAPATVQRGVEDLLKEIASVPRKGLTTVEIGYWLVGTRPGAAPKDQSGELSEVARALGSQLPANVHLELIEKLRLQSMTDESAEMWGRNLQVHQMAAASEGRIVADLRLSRSHESSANRVETRVQLTPGQLLVLAESGDQPDTSLFFAIKAEMK
jgi:hypothetical protein